MGIRAYWAELRSKMVKDPLPPERVAAGWALGMFVGCAIPFGLQLVVSIPLAIMMRVSKIGATVGTLITNPVTIFFIYPAQTWVMYNLLFGNREMGELPSATALSESSGPVFISFFLGGLVLALILSPLTYFLVRRIVHLHRQRKDKELNMAKRRVSVVMSAVALAAAATIGWFAHAVFGVKPARVVRASSADPFVAVGEVRLEKFNPPEEFVGHVEPVQEVDILPQIEGYIREVKFAEGDAVKAGDLLFEIDDERYAAEEGVARATLAQAQAKVGEAMAAVDRSARYLKRLESADQRGITQTEKDAAETGLAADRAALASAKAAVAQAEASLASTAFSLKHAKIYAPISGRIGKTLMHAGDYVSPSKGALARIVQTDPVRVCFPITDRAYLAWSQNANSRGAVLGDTRRLRLRLADGSLYPVCGAWEFSDNEMSAETATLIVRAQFPNPAHALVPNAYVTVLADEADPQPTTVIPAMAVAKSGSTSGVWVLTDDDQVSFRPIEIRSRLNDRVQVAAGVKPGERIVIQGVHKLGEGMRVQVVPASHFQ